MSPQLRQILPFSVLFFALLLWGNPAHAELRQRQVVEADFLVAFGESLGRAPLMAPGAGIEFGLRRYFGLSVGGFAAIATPTMLSFFDDTGVGGGWNLAVRLYVRGGWPRGFGVGAAAGMMVIEGVAAATPRLEIFYRFVLLSHLALRLNAVVGGLFLWDTALGDERPGPPVEEYVDGSISGLLLGVGVSIGWSSERVTSRRRVRRRP